MQEYIKHSNDNNTYIIQYHGVIDFSRGKCFPNFGCFLFSRQECVMLTKIIFFGLVSLHNILLSAFLLLDWYIGWFWPVMDSCWSFSYSLQSNLFKTPESFRDKGSVFMNGLLNHSHFVNKEKKKPIHSITKHHRVLLCVSNSSAPALFGVIFVAIGLSMSFFFCEDSRLQWNMLDVDCMNRLFYHVQNDSVDNQP